MFMIYMYMIYDELGRCSLRYRAAETQKFDYWCKSLKVEQLLFYFISLNFTLFFNVLNIFS